MVEPLQANTAIRSWAAEHDEGSARLSSWDFVCECGDPDCHEHVDLSLALYDEVRRAAGHVIAPEHVERYERGRAARARAAVIREESRAVRAQASLQVKRTQRLRTRGSEAKYCANCGYGVAVKNPPLACPMCRSSVWRTR